MSKKIVSFFLALVMICLSFLPGNFSIFEITANASQENLFSTADMKITSLTDANGLVHTTDLYTWDGKTTAAPATGDGSQENPYEISNAKELVWYAKYVNGEGGVAVSTARSACAVLTNDIDLGGKNWYSYRMGKGSYYYGGQFNGQGHIIYNFYVETSEKEQGGLFAKAGPSPSSTATIIENINFVNAKAVSSYTGTSVGDAGTSILCGHIGNTTSIIRNIRVSGIITVSGYNECVVTKCGSIAASLNQATITDCYSDVYIDLRNAKNIQESFSYDPAITQGVGGIVGRWRTEKQACYIQNCTFAGKIDAPQNSRVGGIVGNLTTQYWLRLYNCSNEADITGFRQVAGIAGWIYNGNYISGSAGPKGIYNTGNIVAKTSTDTYAAGLANGFTGEYLTNYTYSSGNVSVAEIADGVQSPDFNSKCALLYTTRTNATSSNVKWDSVYAAYNKDFGKAPLSAGGVHTTSTTNLSAFTDEEFKNGTATETLNKKTGTTWKNISGLNDGYPISTELEGSMLYGASTYVADNTSLSITVKSEGYASFEITPIDGNATVTVGLSQKEIIRRGTYSFYFPNVENTLSVEGKVYITKNLYASSEPHTLSELRNIPIKVSFPDNKPRSVMIGLYKDKVLKEFKYFSEVAPVVLDGKSTVSAIINLTDVDITDCTLKAYL